MLPFDLSYFEQFYSKYIVSLWTASKDDFKKKGVAADDCFENCKSISAKNPNLSLNTDDVKTVIWEDSITPEDFFSSALALRVISLVCTVWKKRAMRIIMTIDSIMLLLKAKKQRRKNIQSKRRYRKREHRPNNTKW